VIPYSFHPEAEAELDESALFYESRVRGLGKSFASEVQRTISLIRQFPEAGSRSGDTTRKVLVDRFPYSIVYRQASDAVVIVAFAHVRRRPGYWHRRK
jgi:toxin ParE1/3/4